MRLFSTLTLPLVAIDLIASFNPAAFVSLIEWEWSPGRVFVTVLVMSIAYALPAAASLALWRARDLRDLERRWRWFMWSFLPALAAAPAIVPSVAILAPIGAALMVWVVRQTVARPLVIEMIGERYEHARQQLVDTARLR